MKRTTKPVPRDPKTPPDTMADMAAAVRAFVTAYFHAATSFALVVNPGKGLYPQVVPLTDAIPDCIAVDLQDVSYVG